MMNLKNSGNNRATNKRINLPTADYPPNIINLLMNKMKKDKHIKVLFHLEQDEDGYPPFSIEGLWCKKASNDTYIVDNVPFYTYGISLGDEICVTEEDGEYHFQSIVNPSGNSTLRVHFNDKRMQMVRDKLLDMGCKVEISNLPSFISINVPQEVSLKVVEDVLTNMQKECDSLAYEHGVVRQNIS